MEDKKVKEIIYFRESALQSIVSDTFMFGGILGLLYFNHEVLSGSWVVDSIFILTMFFIAYGRAKNKNYHRFTNWEELKEFVNKETK